ncbi:hypothetical protein COV11_01760 [Candidatus Woesearchaeota archaeon CG10_big_fil_rev_8_21_14_0_10_30_7]|nr:MAG: hypothetical protein COV11_01760 [Candidatus Woesearchaeota archaeon CG10_big_fil_rev_8_21_14_0_10_30_7]
MTKALYAFSGDPITNGHIDIVERASKIFNELIVGIGTNPEKINKYLFSLEERTEMAEKSLAHLANVKVVSYEGLLPDYVYEQNMNLVVRGIRNPKDFEAEKMLYELCKKQSPQFEAHLLFANPNLSQVSSSTVKDLQKDLAEIHKYVPMHVKQKLEENISKQYVIGVIGEIGVGKSYVCNRFKELANKAVIEIHHIDLDKIGHQILGELTEPAYETIRTQIEKNFGSRIRLADGFINRKKLGEIVFNDPEKLSQLNKIMYEPLKVRLRNSRRGKKGLILLDAALLVEAGWTYLCNNNVVAITTHETDQKKRLKKRNLTDEQIKRRLESQYSFAVKKTKLLQKINEDNNGNLWKIINRDIANNIDDIFAEVVKDLKIK